MAHLLLPSASGMPAFYIGKLEEWVFSHSFVVASAFAVPLRPDQDTSEIPNAEDERDLSPASSHSVKQHGTDQSLVNSSIISLTQTRANPLAFSYLPVELHDLVFQELGIQDLLCLSITCRYFWIVGQKHIQNYWLSMLGPYAGESIICLGDSLLADADLPEALPEAQKAVVRQVLGCDWDEDDLSSCYNDTYTKSRGCFPLEITYCQFKYQRFLGLNSFSMFGMIEYPSQTIPQYYPENEPWILRNLTTKEYVRSEAIALKPEYIHGPFIDALGFGEVILSRICWSTNNSVATPYKGSLHRGIWAGHRFDIRTFSSHEKLTKAEDNEWGDISEEVAKGIETIWECEYGSDWREILIEGEEYSRECYYKFLNCHAHKL